MHFGHFFKYNILNPPDVKIVIFCEGIPKSGLDPINYRSSRELGFGTLFINKLNREFLKCMSLSYLFVLFKNLVSYSHLNHIFTEWKYSLKCKCELRQEDNLLFPRQGLEHLACHHHKSGVEPLWVCDDLAVRADSHCWLPSTRLSSRCCRVRPSRTQTCISS